MRDEIEKRVWRPCIGAGLHHRALEPLRVLRVEDNDDVAAIHGLRYENGERDTFPRLRGAGDACTTLEIQQRPIKWPLFGLHAVDIRHADFLVWLRIDLITERAQDPRGNEVVAIVDFCQLVQALRMDRLPFEAETEEHLFVGSGTVTPQAVGCDDLHRASAQRSPNDENARGLEPPHDSSRETCNGQDRQHGPRGNATNGQIAKCDQYR